PCPACRSFTRRVNEQSQPPETLFHLPLPFAAKRRPYRTPSLDRDFASERGVLARPGHRLAREMAGESGGDAPETGPRRTPSYPLLPRDDRPAHAPCRRKAPPSRLGRHHA